jgi:hypothetical protein
MKTAERHSSGFADSFASQIVVCSMLGSLLIGAHVNAEEMSISVDDPRPLAKALDNLSTKYEQLISYEDPAYAYSEDVRDATSEVRRDGKSAVRVIVPAGGVIDVRGVPEPNARDAASARSAVFALVESQATRSNGGRFRVIEDGNRYHIVPTQVRNERGEWVGHTSILDGVISLPRGKKTVLDALKDFCAALSRVTGTQVAVGTVPLNVLIGSTLEVNVDQQNARRTLVTLLDATGRRISSQMFFAPDQKMYVLNLRLLPVHATPASPPSRPSIPSDRLPTGKRSTPGTSPRHSDKPEKPPHR